VTTRPESIAGRIAVGGRVDPGVFSLRPFLCAARLRLARARVSSEALLAVGLLALSGLAFAGVARVPVFVDEANNVLGACLIARGSVVYRDVFFHHFPLPYYLLASLGEHGACSVLAARYLGLAALTLAIATVAWIIRNPLAPLALLVMTLSGPAYYLQRYLAETMLSVGLILTLALLTDRGCRLGGPAGHGLRIAALVILTSSSQIGLMMAGLLMPLMLVRAVGHRAWLLATGAVALLVWPAVFAAQGALQAFVDQAILFNTQIYSAYLDVRLTSPVALLWQSLAFVRHRFSFVVDWIAGQDVDASAASYAAGFELALVVLLAALLVMNRRDVLFRLGVCLLFPLAVARDGFHLSPFIALSSLACAQLMCGVVGRSRLVQAAAVTVMILALRIYFLFLPTELDAPDELAASLRPDSRVLQHASQDDTILFLPMSPDGYLTHDRRPGSFYTFFLPWQAEIPGAEDRLIADIERNQVAVIVMDQETAVWDKYQFSEYAPRVYAHILKTYRPLDSRDRHQARIFIRGLP
jgi:uncharacterized membrane protein YbaN (DUF454 family)